MPSRITNQGLSAVATGSQKGKYELVPPVRSLLLHRTKVPVVLLRGDEHPPVREDLYARKNGKKVVPPGQLDSFRRFKDVANTGFRSKTLCKYETGPFSRSIGAWIGMFRSVSQDFQILSSVPGRKGAGHLGKLEKLFLFFPQSLDGGSLLPFVGFLGKGMIENVRAGVESACNNPQERSGRDIGNSMDSLDYAHQGNYEGE